MHGIIVLLSSDDPGTLLPTVTIEV